FTEALDLAKKTGNKIAEASITSIIGHAYLGGKDLAKAESNLQAALTLAQSLGLRRVMRHAYSGLVDIRLAQGKGNEAVVYLQRYYAVRDSLLNTSKVRQIVELEAKHELALREKNIQLLENQKRIDTIWKNLLIGLTVLVVVAAVAVIQWQRFRYKKNRELLNLEIDHLKSRQAPEVDDKIASYEQRLLKQAISIVEDNIADSQLSVEKMAEQMNMSRTSLHRKIKTITGFPPSELIRSIRLRKAASMIANRVDSATQIAQAVGFEDYSHFSKAFKKHFGVSPSGYEEQANRP
ncbi:MAG TPA: helix-turn-helix domain-containing protein, partial [Cyclobacteriaceae bacterium]|nr:helix-turn-helix domain-containing protein [Cyclobacteriaceae bacterium]